MSEAAARQQLAGLLTGYWVSQALYVAAKLGIADLLSAGPRDPEDLAGTVSAHPRSLYRLLRALASIGVFRELDDGRFALTPLAEGLRGDAPDSMRAWALMMGEEQYRAWGDLLGSVRTGRTGFKAVFGESLFDYLATRPETAAVFDAAMTSIHGRETDAVVDVYDFAPYRVLADVGGGNGSTIRGILGRCPTLQGILFDLPGVIERGRRGNEEAGFAERCRLVAGSFFESVPEGADVYLLRHIIHDWDDDKAVAILRTVRRAMQPSARLLIVESVIPPGNEPSFGKLLDLAMLVVPGGLERTESEYRAILGAAGFQLVRVVPTRAEVSIIEAIPH
jgi:hypothetical protein